MKAIRTGNLRSPGRGGPATPRGSSLATGAVGAVSTATPLLCFQALLWQRVQPAMPLLCRPAHRPHKARRAPNALLDLAAQALPWIESESPAEFCLPADQS